MAKSLMEIIAALPEEERLAALDGLDMDALVWDWSVWARPEQIPPADDSWAVWLMLAGRGAGKDLAIETPIMTPIGWVELSDIKVGDVIYAHDGTKTNVIDVYDFSDRDIYRVTFNDGTYLDASSTHEWTILRGKNIHIFSSCVDVRDASERSQWPSWRRPAKMRGNKVIEPPADLVELAVKMRESGYSWRYIERHFAETRPDVRQIGRSRTRLRAAVDGTIPSGTPYKDRKNIGAITVETGDLRIGDAIPTTAPLEFDNADLLIDPYLFGLWLGDGFTASGAICGAPSDLKFYLQELKRRGAYDDWILADMDTNCGKITSASFGNDLKTLGLRAYKENGKTVKPKKAVPREYLTASTEQRLALLQGIMDTDGTVDLRTKRGVGIGLVNQDLADAVYDLATSLGWIVRRRIRMLKATDSKPERPFYGCSWYPDGGQKDLIPFLLPRKKNALLETPRAQASRKTMRRVVSIEKIGTGRTRCVAVDHPDHLFLAGKGLIATHNTRSAAEWVRERAKYTDQGKLRFALVARTAADVRDVLVEGESGIMNVCPPSEMPKYEPSKRRLTWESGHTATCFTADEPDSLRGIQAHYSWADELAAWRQTPDAAGMTAWDNLRVATRLGRNPQIVATTTPKRVPVLYSLLDEAKKTGRVYISRGSTMDNAGNLSATYLDTIMGVYAGTRLAQQELYGEMLDDVEGALWTLEMIESARQGQLPMSAPLRVVGVDPSVAENPRDSCGIVVCSAMADHDLYKRHAWVLEDATVHGSPEVWANAVVAMARKWQAPVVAEINQGGALVRNAIQAVDPSVKVLEVHSKHGKALRAEPIVLAYEQHRVHHVGILADLEAQMCAWIPGESKSPDRIDALVHAMTALIIKPPPGFAGGRLTAKSFASRRLPSMRGGAGGGSGRVFVPR